MTSFLLYDCPKKYRKVMNLMGVHQYFKSLSDLEQIIRCPGKFIFEEHSITSHSFKVTKIAQIENNRRGIWTESGLENLI